MINTAKSTKNSFTIRDLLEIYRRELTSQEIQPLPKDFYSRVKELVKVEGRGFRKEIKQEEEKTLSEILSGIFLLRISKIVSYLLNNRSIDRKILTVEEVEFLDSLIGLLIRIRGKPLARIGEVSIKKDLVVFLKHYPSFVATDGNMYGPFSKDDIAFLPHVDSIFLQRRGVVTIIKESSIY